jgi:hypothetical protein
MQETSNVQNIPWSQLIGEASGVGDRVLVALSEIPSDVPRLQPFRHWRFDTDESIIKKINGVLADGEMYDEGEPRPSQDVARRVKALLRRTKFLVDLRFPVAEVRPFDGSIRITWTRFSKNVRLVCSDHDNYIFHERVDDGRSFDYAIARSVDPPTLARWLNWLRYER